MNRAVRRVALTLGLALAALFVQLNYDQVIAGHRFATNPHNRRLLVKEYSSQRGDIITADNEQIAHSVATDDKLKYLREYPLKDLVAEITGYYSIVYGGAGLERSFNAELAGKKPVQVQSLTDQLLGRDRKGNSLKLTLDLSLQKIAAQTLGKQRGAVVALDPDTGAVLALYSRPGYDPTLLSGHDTGLVRRNWEALNRDPLQPLIARTYQERYPPGSTFKVVVAAAALEAGLKPTDTFPNPQSIKLPLSTKRLGNFGNKRCAGGVEPITFADGLRVSCNTTFAQIGMKIGAQKLIQMAERFGIDRAPEFDLAAIPSCIRTSTRGCAPPTLDAPQTALSSIGQFDIRMTPLQMAMIAAAIANGGTLVRPYLVKEVEDYNGLKVEDRAPKGSGPIFSAQTALTLRQMMINVVTRGTGRSVQVPGVEIGGKTGTAETGVPGKSPHAWFIAFAPHIAVAVVVENGGDLGDDATGGKVAAPIAKALIQAVAARGAPK